MGKQNKNGGLYNGLPDDPRKNIWSRETIPQNLRFWHAVERVMESPALISLVGSESLAAYIAGVGGTLTIFTSLAAIPLGLWISTRLGKREGTLAGLAIVAFSFALLPVALTPAHPWWSVIVSGTERNRRKRMVPLK